MIAGLKEVGKNSKEQSQNRMQQDLSPKQSSDSHPSGAPPAVAVRPTMRPSLTEGADLAPEHRSVSIAAVVSTILALISPAALLHPVLWLIPTLAFLLGAVAWHQINRSPVRVGRTAAAFGCVVGAFALAAAVAERSVYRHCLAAECGEFGRQWFVYLAEQAPHKAHALTLSAQYRPGLLRDEAVWEFYRAGPQWRRELDSYVKDRLVRALLALGRGAKVRYLGCEGFGLSGDHLAAYPLYAVTFGEGDQKTTFFVRMTLEKQTHGSQTGAWRLLRAEGGVRPADWADRE